MSRLKGKVAVISGGNSGIGLAIAQRSISPVLKRRVVRRVALVFSARGRPERCGDRLD
jgi:NAD(P)-dependent dehydrogenase (short-subunit alcohol dehydrogenase family)